MREPQNAELTSVKPAFFVYTRSTHAMNPTNITNLNQLKQSLIEEIDKRVDDRILEPTNAALLRKLILQASNINEALSIAALGTTYKRTGLHFDQRFERMTDSIAYFRPSEALFPYRRQPTYAQTDYRRQLRSIAKPVGILPGWYRCDLYRPALRQR